MKNIGNTKVAASHFHGVRIQYRDLTEDFYVVLSNCESDAEKRDVADTLMKTLADWETMDGITLLIGALETRHPKTLSGWMKRNFPNQDRRYYYWDGAELCTDRAQ